MNPPTRSTVALARLVVMSALIIASYYLIPVERGVTGEQLLLRSAGTLVGGVLVTWLIISQVRHQLADPQEASLIGLLAAIIGGVAFFALVDFTVAISGRDQFVGLETKTDALYFALATLTTVGYGDVHPVSQIARGVVVVQLVFNVVIIATGISVLTKQLGSRLRDRGGSRQPS